MVIKKCSTPVIWIHFNSGPKLQIPRSGGGDSSCRIAHPVPVHFFISVRLWGRAGRRWRWRWLLPSFLPCSFTYDHHYSTVLPPTSVYDNANSALSFHTELITAAHSQGAKYVTSVEQGTWGRMAGSSLHLAYTSINLDWFKASAAN